MTRIDIVGAGSLGMLFAAKLGEAGAAVRLIARSGLQADEINRRGLAVSDPADPETFRQVKVKALDSSCFENECEDGPGADWILLTVKQRDVTDKLAAVLSGKLKSCGSILCFQNGIGHAEKLSEAVPSEAIWIAVTTEASRKESPWQVRHTGTGLTSIGEAVAGRDRDRLSWAHVETLAGLLGDAGFKSILSNDIESAVWNKLLMNSVINPLTAILRVRNGDLLRSEETLLLMRRLLEEGRQIAAKLGIQTAHDLWDRLVEVCKATSANHSSMLQDILNGRPTEIDWINGSLLRYGEREGLCLHTHRILYTLVKASEALNASGRK